MAGARSKLTPELQERLVELVSRGVRPGEAAALAGISRQTFDAWVRRGREGRGGEFVAFADAIDRARAQCEATLVEAMVQASKTSWRACAWMLEHGFAENWARVKPAKAPSEDVKPDGLAALDELAERRRGAA